MYKLNKKKTEVTFHLCFCFVTLKKKVDTVLFFEKKSRQKKLRLSGMICRAFDNCINGYCNVGEGSPLPPSRLYRYKMQDFSSLRLSRRESSRWSRVRGFSLLWCISAHPSRRRLQWCFAPLQIPPVSATPAMVLRTLANPSRTSVFIDM